MRILRAVGRHLFIGLFAMAVSAFLMTPEAARLLSTWSTPTAPDRLSRRERQQWLELEKRLRQE